MVIETGLIVGWLAAWAAKKARHVGSRVDDEADRVLDSVMDRLHDVVTAKLGGDSALAKLEREAAGGQPTELTRQRVDLSLQDAIADDPLFAAALMEITQAARESQATTNQAAARGEQAVAIAGGVNIEATHGSASAWSMNDVHIDAKDRGGDTAADPS